MGYEQLKEILKQNKQALEDTKREQENPTILCPDCNYPFSVNSEGKKACPICGWSK